MKYLASIFTLLLFLAVSSCMSYVPKTTAQIIKDTDSETLALTVTKENDTRVFCTAVWISSDEILTANHCADYAADVFGSIETIGTPISYSTKSEAYEPFANPTGSHRSVVVAADPDHDLALLKALSPIPDHRFARIANSVPSVGSHLYFLGHPAGLTWTHVEGTVAAYRPELPVDFYGPFLQVSAPVWFGNSGGGAFNDNGELVGIASFIMKAPNMAFYIPVKSIHNFIKLAHQD